MSNKFGLAAIDAVKFIQNGIITNPIDAWNRALLNYFDRNSSSYEKGCPRNAFLGLCEEGKIIGISSGSYTKSKKNKAYAIKAIKLLRNDPSLAEKTKVLWDMVVNWSGKAHNSQMDIVVALWKENLIR